MRIIIIGAGKLATHLSQALQKVGHEIIQLYSRTQTSAKALADILHVPYTTDTSEIGQNADIYIYAVNDDALESLIELPLAPNAIHVHTAGSVSIDIFKGKKKNYGSFYPFQTFSKAKEVDFNDIPICIESSNKQVSLKLFELAKSICNHVYEIDSEQRLNLHLAGVFANNFVNHLYQISSDIVESANLPFEIVKPLIMETAEKVQQLSPIEAQTGPAKRNNQTIISKHRDALKHNNELLELYNRLSKMILDANVNQ